eukprot:TRINITY_DN20829_c0_g1_i1.p1 TRINITY_DN20829_c0_g1~~TRINITY_DN20829_c0_g1_i1.p1  ORF type:complete len:129 (-),score=24.61 TRINITY_DN20829_c0_g1_i1:161-547(-)
MENPASADIRILVADDSAPIRLVVERYLQHFGYKPVFVTNGVKALEALSSEAFDLAFLDVHMPEMDGTEVVREIRSQGGTLPIYAMTTPDDSKMLVDCLDCGYNGFLNKPINRDELGKIIDHIISELH